MQSYYWPSASQPSLYQQIHYTLSHGSYEDCKKLVHEYGKETVKKYFLQPKKGLYAPQALMFAKLLLGVDVLQSDYVKVIHK